MAMYGFVALGLPDGMIGTAWPALRSGFGVPLDGLGIVLLVGTAGAVCSSSVAGLVLARVGLRPTIMLAGAIASLGALGAVLSPAFWTFVLAGTAIGVTAGLLDSSLNTTVALSGRNRLLNALHGCYGIGTTIGPLVVTAAILVVSWRPAYGFLLLVELGLVGGWWAAGRHRQRPPISAVPPAGETIEEQVGTPVETSGGALVRPGGEATPAPPRQKRRLAAVVTLGLVVFMVYTGFEVSAGQWGRVSTVALSTLARGHRARHVRLLGRPHRRPVRSGCSPSPAFAAPDSQLGLRHRHHRRCPGLVEPRRHSRRPRPGDHRRLSGRCFPGACRLNPGTGRRGNDPPRDRLADRRS